MLESLLEKNQAPGEVFDRYKEIIKIKPKFFGFKRYCNICGYRFAKFKPSGMLRNKKKCPVCGSLPRHRLLYMLLLPEFFHLNQKRILHFAPEKMLKRMFLHSDADYCDVDINPDKASHVEDITCLTFGDSLFDYILCIHVLEHITDDTKALSELYRVLKPGGKVFIMAPQHKDGVTLEDKSVTTPEGRLKLYGQHDHVRIYGTADLAQRISAAGFLVKIFSGSAMFPRNIIEETGIGGQFLFIASKPEISTT